MKDNYFLATKSFILKQLYFSFLTSSVLNHELNLLIIMVILDFLKGLYSNNFKWPFLSFREFYIRFTTSPL